MSETMDFGDLVLTGDGSYTVYHSDFGECYHSRLGASLEAEDLYIGHSGIRQELETAQRDVAVLDVGLGLAYNGCKTIEAWLGSPGGVCLDLLSLEINPSLTDALKRGVAPWQKSWSPDWIRWCQSLDVLGSGEPAKFISHPRGKGRCRWMVMHGDAATLDLPNYNFRYVWQDAFSPKKNPELWTRDWFEKLGRVSAKDCILLTYSVARVVKDNLQAADWRYEILQNAGPKNRWLRAYRASQVP
jgi:tRNA U34 5-methylaminomethyl-2-thiouridine-forming methyltransferase MnmC